MILIIILSLISILVFNQANLFPSVGAADEEMSDVLSECSEISFLSDFEDEIQSINIDISNGSPINVDNFKIVHYNINSLLAPDRLEQLTDVCRTLKIDVLILSESKLDETIPSNLIAIPGFHEPIRHDRNRHGGGVVMYIAEHLILCVVISL